VLFERNKEAAVSQRPQGTNARNRNAAKSTR
jgi:hypothetical protein